MLWLSTAAQTVEYNTINNPLRVGAEVKMRFELLVVLGLG